MIELNEYVVFGDNFPDGTLLMKLPCAPEKHNEIRWYYENDAELFKLICLTKALRDKYKDTRIDLFIPYLPNARQDRVKNPDDVFTLKYFCEIINSLEFDTVFVTDVHSNVGLALLDRVVEIKPWRFIEKSIREIHDNHLSNDEELMLFYPDEGAMKRYSGDLDLPFAFGVKRRNWETGVIEGLDLMGEVDMIAGRNVLIVDDICSKGGTFYYSAKRLKKAGAANIYLYITHCEQTIFEGELLKDDSLIKHIFTTNTIFLTEHKKITIVE